MTAAAPDPIARLDALAERHQTPCGAGGMVWRAWGAGAPLVLFHGASGAWPHWILNIEPLARRFRVWALDLPGFGDSDDCPEPQTADTLADVVAAGLDVLVPPPARVDFGGFSFGGIIAGLVAARLDARVRTLVLIGAGGVGFRRETPLPELVHAPRGAPAAEVQAAHRENLRRLMFGDPAAADDLSVRIHADNLPRARFKSGSIPSPTCCCGRYQVSRRGSSGSGGSAMPTAPRSSTTAATPSRASSPISIFTSCPAPGTG